MAETKELNYSAYDLTGKKVSESKRLTFPNRIKGIADEAFFQKLYLQLTDYNKKLRRELSEINDISQLDFNDIVVNIAILFSSKQKSHHDRLSRKILLKNLLEQLTILAKKALEVRQGYFLGIGADKKAYHATKDFLSHIAEYLIETSWYEPIPHEIYLLTGLKDSPEKFLKAQTTGFRFEVNLKKDQKNLEENHADQIGKIENQLVNTLTIRLSTLAQRKQTRALRGSFMSPFINFFYDLFTQSSEKHEINALQAECDLLIKTAEHYHRFSKSVPTIVEQVHFTNQKSTLQKMSNKLQECGQVSDQDINTLISVIQSFSVEPYLKEIKNFNDDLIKAINLQFDLSSTKDFNPQTLSNIFRFLAASKALNCNPELYHHTINQIHRYATSFFKPADGLVFIENLKKANVEILDQTIMNEFNALENDYRAWQTTEINSGSLLSGKLNTEDIINLRDAAILLSKSDKIKQAANVGINLEKKTGILLIQQLKLLETNDENEVLIEKLLQFYSLDKPNEKEPFFNDSKNKVVKLITDQLEQFTSEQDGLAYLAKINKIGLTILNKFDCKLAQDIQTKQKQFESLKTINSCWGVLLDDDKAKVLTEKDVNNFIGATLQLDQPNF